MTTAVSESNNGLNGIRKPKPEHLLIADDEHLVAAGIKSNLIKLGYGVVGPASNGVEAVELAKTMRPDMALLDIRMPEMDGLAAGKVISRQFGIPVVIISAFSDPEYLEVCNSYQTFGILLKPVTPDELRATIEVAWSRYLDHFDQKTDIGRLKQRLQDRKSIEQAKWILVERNKISEPKAMKLLQRQARNNRRTIVDVARSLLENETMLTGE